MRKPCTAIPAYTSKVTCSAKAHENNKSRSQLVPFAISCNISTLAFPAYTSILMCSNNRRWHTTKSVVSLKKDYKISLYPSKILQLFGFHMYAVVKTHVMCR